MAIGRRGGWALALVGAVAPAVGFGFLRRRRMAGERSDRMQKNATGSRRMIEEIFGAGNYELAHELVAADAIGHDPARPEPVTGPGWGDRVGARVPRRIPRPQADGKPGDRRRRSCRGSLDSPWDAQGRALRHRPDRERKRRSRASRSTAGRTERSPSPGRTGTRSASCSSSAPCRLRCRPPERTATEGGLLGPPLS